MTVVAAVLKPHVPPPLGYILQAAAATAAATAAAATTATAAATAAAAAAAAATAATAATLNETEQEYSTTLAEQLRD